jgi:signal transduction histidine kinase
MDARSETMAVSPHASPQSLIEHTEIRSILSNLSHELCRPLISLRAGFDLLLSDAARPIADEQRGHVQTMAALCDDLLRLTRSYLDYAGLVQGARPLCVCSFTLGALIRDIDRQFAAMAESRKIRWSCRLEGRDAKVTTDASRCQQIFGNVVANALKYTPEGGEVSTSAGIVGDTWEVTVSDNGPGIPTDAIDRVFAPFYRLPRDERSRVEGNGLGLAICREMVGQLGGQIALASEAGKGTRVCVRFPLDPTSPASDRPACGPAGVEGGG